MSFDSFVFLEGLRWPWRQGEHTAAVGDDGVLFVWGGGEHGELVIGSKGGGPATAMGTKVGTRSGASRQHPGTSGNTTVR